jgi:hypothetical protein
VIREQLSHINGAIASVNHVKWFSAGHVVKVLDKDIELTVLSSEAGDAGHILTFTGPIPEGVVAGDIIYREGA